MTTLTDSTLSWPMPLNTTGMSAPTDRGDGEKVLAMFTLGLGSFLAGMLPCVISERNRRRFPLATSLLLCFGAGILLATALVHILPEVRKQLASNYAEISMCVGFFLIYFIDEFIHYFFGEAIQHTHSHPSSSSNAQRNSNRNYGAINMESDPLLTNTSNNSHNHAHAQAPPAISSTVGHSHAACRNSHVNNSESSNNCDDAAIADANARICHTSHTEPCAQTMTGTLGLFAALSLHSTIEGLAIGVQNSATKVLFLLGAVSCHKFVMGFCLGLEFRSNPQTTVRTQLIGILVFALGAVFGIGIGMLIVDIPSSWMKSVLPVIQALAGGTLFYVTVCEVIPREKARWHQNAARKFAGFAQYFAVISGFAAMCVINFYLDDDDA